MARRRSHHTELALLALLAVAAPALAQPAPAIDPDPAPRESDVLALARARLAPEGAARVAEALPATHDLDAAHLGRALRAAAMLLDGAAAVDPGDVVALLVRDVPSARRPTRPSPALTSAFLVEDLREIAGPSAAAERTLEAARAALARTPDAALAREVDRAAVKVDPAAAVEASVARVLALGRARLTPADAARLADAVALARYAHGTQARDG